MIRHIEIGPARVRSLIRSGRIRFGGNKTLKIYGTLSCSSGKRMKAANRVFFASEAEARQAGYRPCGHCLREQYKKFIYPITPPTFSPDRLPGG